MICKNCYEGHIPLGENFVTHDMALDACDLSLEGQSMGVEWGGCSCCKDEWQDCPRCTRDSLRLELDEARASTEFQGKRADELQTQLHKAEEHYIFLQKRIVQLQAKLDETIKDRDDWKDEYRMYEMAWLREIGGVTVPKTHLIDALVITTRKILKERDALQAKLDKTMAIIDQIADRYHGYGTYESEIAYRFRKEIQIGN